MSSGVNGQYVPWTVYLQDRREQSESNRRLETKLDRLTEKVEALTIAVATDDAADTAAESVTEGIKQSRRSRTERIWELVKSTWAAAAVAAAGLITWWLQGGNT